MELVTDGWHVRHRLHQPLVAWLVALDAVAIGDTDTIA
jgi:hypothetical protein